MSTTVIEEKETNNVVTNSTVKPKKKPKAKSAVQLKNEALRKETKELKIKIRNLTKENILMRTSMRLFHNIFRTFNTKEFITAMKIVNKIHNTNNIIKVPVTKSTTSQ